VKAKLGKAVMTPWLKSTPELETKLASSFHRLFEEHCKE